MDTSKRIPSEREACFPNLLAGGYEKTSPDECFYNCFAWAAGEENTSDWWNPFCLGSGYYWPEGLDRKADVKTFVRLYEINGGYMPCESAEPEHGFEKIAIYIGADNEVTHAARQLPDGTWTSKLGGWEDIRHKTLEGLCGDDPAYGRVAQIVKRPRKQ
jgi:hypothetical protein